jgi:sugar phosphate isomerase/epimerase
MGVAAAGWALPSLARASAAEARREVRLAVRGPFPEKDLRARTQLLSRLGYQGIELGPEYLEQSADQISRQLSGTGISVSAIVGSIKLLDPDPAVRAAAVELDRQRLELARQLGAAGVIEVPTFGPCRFDQGPDTALEDGILVEGLKLLAPAVSRTGVRILLEPLTRKETHYMNRQAHGAQIIGSVGEPGFALLSDFYHMQMEEEDIAATLERFGGHTAYVHLADGEKRTEPGSLPFDYRPGFRQLWYHGYSGWLTVESGATDSPEPALVRARQYILGQWHEASTPRPQEHPPEPAAGAYSARKWGR